MYPTVFTIKNIFKGIFFGICLGLLILLFQSKVFRQQIELEKVNYQMTNQALYESRIIQDKVFCDKYKTFTRPEEAPYAYKHCFR